MLRGVRTAEKFDYISDRDEFKTEEDGATIFELGSISVEIRTEIQDGVMSFDQTTGSGGIQMNTNRQNLKAVRFGLKGWRNFSDDQGNPIDFKGHEFTHQGKKYTGPTDETLAHLPTWLINELGRQVLGANAVSETERKNLNTQ